eukprot:8483801-Alexandrium_andersonii.AAC.1
MSVPHPGSRLWLRGSLASVYSRPGHSTYAQGQEGPRGASIGPKIAIASSASPGPRGRTWWWAALRARTGAG